METALNLAGGLVLLDYVDRPADDPHREQRFSERMACPNEHPLETDELEPRSFSFNSPFGACGECHGLGTRMEVDPELVVTDPAATLAEGVIAPWTGAHLADYFQGLLAALGDELGFDLDTPWEELTAAQRRSILDGHGRKVTVRRRNRFGRERTYVTGYEGVRPYIERRHREAESDTSRERYEGYMRQVPCPECQGSRLKPVPLAVTLGGLSIAEVCRLPINETADFLRTVELSPRERQIAERVLKEIQERLTFLLDVGLDYLSLDRPAGSLSGGEAQRIRLATQIGAGLVGVLYVLDEPSIGLHQRDNHRLIETLLRLRDLGNTLIVVEHDEDTIKVADWVVDIGPGAGEHGGQVVVSGPVQELLDHHDSMTGQYLSRRREIPLPDVRRPRTPGQQLKVVGAREHNLQGIDVAFPLGLFVAVTGVSGSGKSTLVNDILYTALAKKIYNARTVPGRHRKIEGVDLVDKVIHVDQSPIGRTPRSNPATYTGVFDHVRKLFAATPEAKMRGYQPGRFSFNVKGGRCEACSGDGTIKIEMNFLPDVYVPCEVCHGARYNRETLEVHYKGRTIAEVLDMPIEEAVDFFAAVPAIRRHLATLVDVGLGYVRLGQPAPTLSGGEAQRVKLATELQKRSTGRTVYVLDEPTTGLHFEDIRKLLVVLGRLVDQGNTVLVIEHNLDVIKTADWIVDMGPEGGSRGGLVVAQGTPEEVAGNPESHTGTFLRPLLAGSAPVKKGRRKSCQALILGRRRRSMYVCPHEPPAARHARTTHAPGLCSPVRRRPAPQCLLLVRRHQRGGGPRAGVTLDLAVHVAGGRPGRGGRGAGRRWGRRSPSCRSWSPSPSATSSRRGPGSAPTRAERSAASRTARWCARCTAAASTPRPARRSRARPSTRCRRSPSRSWTGRSSGPERLLAPAGAGGKVGAAS